MEFSLKDLLPGVPMAANLIESYAPGTRKRVVDRLVSRFFGGISVPENHVVTRTVRLAWVGAARDILQAARQTANGNGEGEFFADFTAFAEHFHYALDGEANRALDERPQRDLGESPIDAHMKEILSCLGAHLATQLDAKTRKNLSDSFATVVADLTGWEKHRIPAIIQTLAQDGYRVGRGATRGFVERVLDMLARYMQDPNKAPNLHAALLELHMRELKALVSSRDDILTQIPGATKLAETLRSDLDGAESRLAASIGEVGDKVGDVQNVVNDIARHLKETFGDTAGAFTSSAPTLGTENTVIFAWYQGGPDWWTKSANHLRSALDRLGPGYELLPQAWSLNSFDLHTPQGRSHARSGLWASFGEAAAVNLAATVVLVGKELSEPIPCDSLFEDRLELAGLLATSSIKGGFFVADGISRESCRAEIRNGRIPITLETRLILETWLAKRPLLIVDGSGGGPRAIAVDALFDWLRLVEIPIGRTEDMIADDRWALPFLRNVFNITVAKAANPYRRLDHYLPENAAQFFGRDEQTDQVRDWIGSPGGILSITGPSGVGKSSFLNARVTSVMVEVGYEHVIFRPTDLQVGRDGRTAVSGFCEMLADKLGLGAVDHPLVHVPNPKTAGAAALEWAESVIPGKRRLFLAIDQFEEVVDNIANGLAAEDWRAVLSLVAELARIRAYPLAITLENSRRGVYEKFMDGTAYHKTFEISLADEDHDFARAVITEPFEDGGFTLGDDVVDKLLGEFIGHSTDEIGGTGASALPLLALKLYGLFNHVTRNPVLAAKSSRQIFGDGGAEITLRDLGDFPLSITEEIKNLADQAWNETGGGTEADLGAFLRPYISVVPGKDGSESGRLVLESVPARPFYTVANRQHAFLQRRLIVPTPGGYRLTHQAVIHRWPLAATWFKKEAVNIQREGLFLQRAAAWGEAGQPKVTVATLEDVSLAARLLSLRSIDWSVADQDNLHADERIQRSFALAVFATTDQAEEQVEGSEKGGRYIHIAAGYGMLDMLRRMLDKSPEVVNLSRNDGRTVLATAAWYSADAVAFLLERGADPNAVEEHGFTALDSAIWGQNDAAFDLLLARSEPDHKPEERNNPLYSAARCNRLDYMAKLEQRGFRHDASSLNGLDSLMGAAISGDRGVFDYCLARCDLNRRSHSGRSAFDLLAEYGRTQLMLAMLKQPNGILCLEPEQDRTSALMLAATFQRPESIRFLMKAGALPNVKSQEEGSEGRTAVHFALDWLARHKGPAPRFVVDLARDTLSALLQNDKLDVSIADKNGNTAYAMAQHHPALQSMIAAHPSFIPSAIPAGSDTPLHSLINQLRKNQSDGTELRAQIRAILADQRYMNILTQPGANQKVPVAELTSLGFGDDLLALIQQGKLDPWPQVKGAAVLPAAWQARHAELADAAVTRMPDKVSVEQVASILEVLSLVSDPDLMNVCDPEFAVATLCLARCPDPQAARTQAILTAARLGNLALFDRLLADGANLAMTDSWGRGVMDRASDFICTNRASAIPKAVLIAAEEKAPTPKLTTERRVALASGDIETIANLVKSLTDDTFPDVWGRMPSDFVPDAIVAEVCQLQTKSNGKGSS